MKQEEHVIDIPPCLVKVKTSCLSVRGIVLASLAVIAIFFFIGFIVYYLVDQFEHQDLKKTNSTNV
jgi:hypothetical protein